MNCIKYDVYPYPFPTTFFRVCFFFRRKFLLFLQHLFRFGITYEASATFPYLSTPALVSIQDTVQLTLLSDAFHKSYLRTYRVVVLPDYFPETINARTLPINTVVNIFLMAFFFHYRSLQAQRRRAVLEQRGRRGLGQRNGWYAHNHREVRKSD